MRRILAYILFLSLSTASFLSWAHKMDAHDDLCHDNTSHICVEDHHACLLCEEYLSDVDVPQVFNWEADGLNYLTTNEALGTEVLSTSILRQTDRGPPLD